jgi:hypothetical protein
MNEGIPPQTPPLGEKKRGVHVSPYSAGSGEEGICFVRPSHEERNTVLARVSVGHGAGDHSSNRHTWQGSNQPGEIPRDARRLRGYGPATASKANGWGDGRGGKPHDIRGR